MIFLLGAGPVVGSLWRGVSGKSGANTPDSFLVTKVVELVRYNVSMQEMNASES